MSLFDDCITAVELVGTLLLVRVHSSFMDQASILQELVETLLWVRLNSSVTDRASILPELVETLRLVCLNSSLTTSLDVERSLGDDVEPALYVCFNLSLSVRPRGDESIERLAECCHKGDLY